MDTIHVSSNCLADNGVMIGERLAQARKRAGLAQVELAAAMGSRYDQSVISAVEHGRSALRFDGLVRAARELKVSTDYLFGLTDDPTPADQRNGAMTAREPSPAYALNGEATPVRHIELVELAAAAGSGAEVYDETVVSRLAFRHDWLTQRGIDPRHCHVISVQGDSMEPTLPDGSSILVDRNRREPQEDRIFVLRTEDGLVVKRLARDARGSWQLVSENADHPTVPLLYGAEFIGEVRWMGRTL